LRVYRDGGSRRPVHRHRPASYLKAQTELVFAAREAHDEGVAVTERHTTWLGIPAEQAAIEARIEADEEEAQSRQVDDAVGKVLDALRTAGYQPALRIEDISTKTADPSPSGLPHSRPTRGNQPARCSGNQPGARRAP
jgi:hypothetical protein